MIRRNVGCTELLSIISQPLFDSPHRRPCAARDPCCLSKPSHKANSAFVSTAVRTLLSRFFPDRATLSLAAWHVDAAAAQITLDVTSTHACVPCPLCDVQTTRVHSRYTRTVADVPWGAYAVRLRLRGRAGRCGSSSI